MRCTVHLLVSLALSLPTDEVNLRPIVGVLTQPLGAEGTVGSNAGARAGNTTYIAASYVKFLESAGARVVPVHYDSSAEELTALFNSINGLLLPGGGADLSNTTRIRRSGQHLYKLAIAANEAGDAFPIWGTCMGFQFLSLLTSGKDSILCHDCYNSMGVPLPLEFVEPAASQSSLFGGMDATLKQWLATQKLTANSHHDGIKPATFDSDARLKAFYNVLSTNVDSQGRPFVSSFEAKSYPFAGTQWHPEKNNFEWGTTLGPRAIPHGAAATAVSQYVADFVVSQARRSTHRFATSDEEAAALIYNYPAVPDPSSYFSQVYLFQRPTTQPTTRA